MVQDHEGFSCSIIRTLVCNSAEAGYQPHYDGLLHARDDRL